MVKPPPATFGKYQILERIAIGGMAEIYKARLEGIGGFQRTFAIKRILPHLSMNSEYVEMLVDEAKVAGLLSHANIVQILDLGQVDKVWYIAMEFVPGRDLGGVLKRAQERGLRLPVPHACFIAIELLKGLEYAHQRQVMRGGRPVPLNIIHRDVSPPNILLSFQGEVKLTDFGIARASLKAQETQAGVIKGRFDYMSPEQAEATKDLDQRSDLFAVGVVLYEMLAGKHPFRQEGELATLEAVRSGRYPRLGELNPDVPLSLQSIVDRALLVERNERFPTATAFKEALDRFFHEAGFVFTHATLAAYLKALFPEDQKEKTVERALGGLTPPPVERRPIAPEPLVLDESTDGPTRVINARAVHAEASRQAADGRFGLQPGEEATQVRANPLKPAAADSGARASWDMEQETVIKPIPPHLEGGTSQSRSAPGPVVEQSTVTKAVGGAAAAAIQEAARQPKVVVKGFGVVSLVAVGLVGCAIGFFLGAGTGGLVGVLFASEAPTAGVASGGSAVAPPLAPPVLRVQAPPGATIRVDDRPVKGAITLSPGVPHVVEVTVEGVPPWRQELTLVEGEVRALLVTPAQLAGPRGTP